MGRPADRRARDDGRPGHGIAVEFVSFYHYVVRRVWQQEFSLRCCETLIPLSGRWIKKLISVP